jgi:hypothetical protein
MGRRTGRRKHRPKSAKRAKHTDMIPKKRGPRNESLLKLLRGETRRARLRQQTTARQSIKRPCSNVKGF